VRPVHGAGEVDHAEDRARRGVEDRGCGAGHVRQLVGGLPLDRAAELIRPQMRDRLSTGRDHAGDQLWPHRRSVIRDRRGDHRHLQRRHLQPLLSERKTPRIDLRVRMLRIEEPAGANRGGLRRRDVRRADGDGYENERSK